MTKVAFLGYNNEDEFFRLTFISVLKQLGLEYLQVSSDVDEDSFKFAVINSSVIEKRKEIKCSYLLVNMDKVNKTMNTVEGNLITYGFGSKNTVTISSIGKDNSGFVYCLQRFVNLNSVNILEPQEIPVLTNILSEEHLYPYMVAITIALLEGIKCEEVKKNLDSKNLIFSV